MKKQFLKSLCIGLILLFSLGIFAGCSSAELGFYNTLKSAATMDGSVKTDTTIKVAITSDDPSWKETVGEEVASALEDMNIIYTVKANLDNMSEEIDMTVKVGKVEKHIGSMKLVDGMLYVNVKDMLAFLEESLPQQSIDALEAAMQGNDWISFDFMATFDPSGILPENYLQEARSIVNLYYNFMDQFFVKGYKNYSAGMVTRVGSGYQFTMTDADLVKFIRSSGKYTVNNIQEIGNALKVFIAGTSDAEKELIFGTNGISASDVDDLIMEVLESKGELNESIDELADLLETDFLPMIAGSKCEMTIEGTSKGYKDRVTLSLVLNDEDGNNMVNIFVDCQENIEKIANLSIQAPENAIDWNVVKKGLPTNKDIRIFDDKSYFVTEEIDLTVTSIPCDSKFGYMTNWLEKDGYRYYPLRQIGEALGHEVGWSEAGQTAYVVNENGARVSFSGIEQNGTMYIKIRDFEKIGYTVEWDEDSQSIYLYK